MPSPVFYSLSPFGTGTIETGAGNISITSGVATLTVEQTGNIGAGVCIEYNSLECWIAPNRIGFDSGGTTELLPDTKIEDATSGATGIVRFVEVTSGTWAGGDAAGWIYFESTTGTFGDNNQINRTKPTTSNNIATVDGTIEGNIGNGNTEFVVKSATGGTPANQSATAVTSIHHEYASLSAFEAGFTDANHINDADLTNADVVAHACCYYDHDDYTADSASAIINWGGTTDATRYLQILTLVGYAESLNNQRHSGVWDGNKSYMQLSISDRTIELQELVVKTQGLQLDIVNTTVPGIDLDPSNANSDYVIDSVIIKNGAGTYQGSITIADPNSMTVKIINTIIYNNSGAYGKSIHASQSGTTFEVLHCTVCDTSGTSRGIGVSTDNDPVCTATNNAVFNNTDDFAAGANGTVSYCASDDGDGTNAIDWDNGATDWAANFTDYANGDFSVKDTNADIYQAGTDLSSSEGIWRDIAGTERSATPCIGAFEYAAAGGGLSINVSETITSTESLTESMPLGEILKFDNVTIAEFRALLMSIAPSVFQNISISEYLSLIVAIKPDIHQDINITEAITILKDIGVDVNEQISIQEIIAILLEFSVNVSENFQIQELVALAISGAGEISKSETISIVEALTMALPLGGISAFEAIELIEYIKVSLPISTTIIQQLTVQEYLSLLMRVSPSVFENIEISEFAQLLMNISPDIFESINISEYTAAAIGAVSINVSVYDVLSVVENIVMSMSMSTTISQVIQVTENIIVLLNPLIFNQSDTISIIESITVMVGILAVGRVTAAITSKAPGATITSKAPGATIT